MNKTVQLVWSITENLRPAQVVKCFVNGQEISNDEGRIHVFKDDDKVSLYLANTNVNDSGMYYCDVTGHTGSSTVHLEVYGE